MHLIRCVSIRNLFQMKLINVICNLESLLNREFEYDEELWLIWEKNNNKNARTANDIRL
jgi:hypothetical protein